jgi:hypothetical protein
MTHLNLHCYKKVIFYILGLLTLNEYAVLVFVLSSGMSSISIFGPKLN